MTVQMLDWLVAEAGPGGVHEGTLLVIVGDHGMTAGGEHGGGSPEEVDSALFAASMRRLHAQRCTTRPNLLLPTLACIAPPALFLPSLPCRLMSMQPQVCMWLCRSRGTEQACMHQSQGY